jgi:hypothetical protein
MEVGTLDTRQSREAWDVSSPSRLDEGGVREAFGGCNICVAPYVLSLLISPNQGAQRNWNTSESGTRFCRIRVE